MSKRGYSSNGARNEISASAALFFGGFMVSKFTRGPWFAEGVTVQANRHEAKTPGDRFVAETKGIFA